MIRAVFDTNVWISSFIRPENPPGQLRMAVKEDRIELCCSRLLLEELEDVLSRPRFRRDARVRSEEIDEFLELLPTMSFFIEKLDVKPVIEDDPDDDVVLATALAARADIIVSGDRHLVSLGSYEGIPVLTPRQAMDLITKTAT